MNKLTIVAAVALCTTLQMASPNISSAQAPSRDSAAAQTTSAVSLKQDMRKLWTDHVVWSATTSSRSSAISRDAGI